MKRSTYSEQQIVKILKEAEAGVSVEALSRQYGFGKSTFYKWKAKYGGMETSDLKRYENWKMRTQKLKQMYAELSLDYKLLKDVVEKKL